MDRSVRTIVVLVVALVAATVASYLVYVAIERASRPKPMQTTATVVAARNVPVGTLLTKDDVKVVRWPTEHRMPGTFMTTDEVTNRGTVAPISENEPLVASKLAAAGSGAGLPPIIPAGKRALSIRVNEVIGVAGFVVPGTRVDVMVTMDKQGGAEDGSMTRVVVSNVEVLTAGTRYDQEKSQADGKPIPTTVVTLLVTPDDAERLALAQNEGKINLTLRNPLDTDPSSTPGARVASLLGKQTTPPPPLPVAPKPRRPPQEAVVVAPPAPEPKPYTVEAIRAAKRTEEAIR
jgi:pilus assembly protein CpaB